MAQQEFYANEIAACKDVVDLLRTYDPSKADGARTYLALGTAITRFFACANEHLGKLGTHVHRSLFCMQQGVLDQGSLGNLRIVLLQMAEITQGIPIHRPGIKTEIVILVNAWRDTFRFAQKEQHGEQFFPDFHEEFRRIGTPRT